jgi:uncharacterized membrane protein YphA (DoxX/SURF4 family)
MAHKRAGSEGIRHAGFWLALIRVVVGLWFLKASVTNVAWVMAAGVIPLPTVTEQYLRFQPKRIAEFASQNPIEWYRGFLEGTVLPHAKLFAFLQSFGEVGVGLGITLGLLTGLCALVGLFLTANYFLASGWMGFCQQGFHTVLLACFVAIFMARAGRTWGLDAWLRRHFPQAWFARVPLLT